MRSKCEAAKKVGWANKFAEFARADNSAAYFFGSPARLKLQITDLTLRPDLIIEPEVPMIEIYESQMNLFLPVHFTFTQDIAQFPFSGKTQEYKLFVFLDQV